MRIGRRKKLSLRSDTVATLSSVQLAVVDGGAVNDGHSLLGSCAYTRCLCPNEPGTYRCGTGND